MRDGQAVIMVNKYQLCQNKVKIGMINTKMARPQNPLENIISYLAIYHSK